MRLTVRRATFPVGAVFAGSAMVVGGVVRLLRLDSLHVPLCTFHAVTGKPCLGCGSTRAVGLLSRLDISGAFAIQPLISAIALGVVLWGLADLVLFIARRQVVAFKCSPREAVWLTWAFFGLALINWVYLIVVGV
jgi:hypothetical protein